MTIKLATKVTIEDILNLSLKTYLKFYRKGIFAQENNEDQIIYEIKNRIELLIELGLQYLTLKRSSGLYLGRSSAYKIASQIGAKLSGIT